MKYVKPCDVFETFCRYIKEHENDLISKDDAIEELQDALENVDFIKMDE